MVFQRGGGGSGRAGAVVAPPVIGHHVEVGQTTHDASEARPPVERPVDQHHQGGTVGSRPWMVHYVEAGSVFGHRCDRWSVRPVRPTGWETARPSRSAAGRVGSRSKV